MIDQNIVHYKVNDSRGFKVALVEFKCENTSYYMISTYSLEDDGYIGNVKLAVQLTELGIAPKKISSTDQVCSIGFSSKENKWYGWSHRAIYGFKIGDVVKAGDCVTSNGFIDEYIQEHPEANTALPVGFTANSLEDCKKMAIAFANSVS